MMEPTSRNSSSRKLLGRFLSTTYMENARYMLTLRYKNTTALEAILTQSEILPTLTIHLVIVLLPWSSK